MKLFSGDTPVKVSERTAHRSLDVAVGDPTTSMLADIVRDTTETAKRFLPVIKHPARINAGFWVFPRNENVQIYKSY